MNTPELDVIFYPNLIDMDFASEVFLLLKETVTWNKKMASRYTESFGVPYHYSAMCYEEKQMPDIIQELTLTVAERTGYKANNCLLNYYLDGDSKMGFHSDDLSQLANGTGVAILSLGVAREILFKHKHFTDIIESICLSHGSLLYMNDKTQQEWLHSIPKSNSQAGRISLTFRQLIAL